jgi:putative hydrolase of the HAD superfamily
MIKAIIFDLDNTLLDFVKMKQFSVKAAITAMNEAGLEVDEKKAYEDIFDLYIERGWENQQVFDDYLNQKYPRRLSFHQPPAQLHSWP